MFEFDEEETGFVMIVHHRDTVAIEMPLEDYIMMLITPLGIAKHIARSESDTEISVTIPTVDYEDTIDKLAKEIVKELYKRGIYEVDIQDSKSPEPEENERVMTLREWVEEEEERIVTLELTGDFNEDVERLKSVLKDFIPPESLGKVMKFQTRPDRILVYSDDLASSNLGEAFFARKVFFGERMINKYVHEGGYRLRDEKLKLKISQSEEFRKLSSLLKTGRYSIKFTAVRRAGDTYDAVLELVPKIKDNPKIVFVRRMELDEVIALLALLRSSIPKGRSLIEEVEVRP